MDAKNLAPVGFKHEPSSPLWVAITTTLFTHHW